MRRTKFLLIATIASALWLAGCGGREKATEPGAAFAQGTAPGGPVLLAETVTARTEPVPDRAAAISGQVEPYEVATVAAEAAEVIVSRPVERGDRVAKGQVVATLDDRTARATLDRAVAAAAQATAARRQAESEYRRAVTETAAAQGQARAALLSARAGEQKARTFTRTQELREAEASLDQAKTDENLARLETDRYRRLVEQGAVAQQVLDRQQAALDAAAARTRAAEQRVSLAQEGARQEDIAAAAAQVRTAESGVLAADSRPDRLAAIRAQIDSLRAQEDGARAAVALARIELGKHVVRAPFAGRVLETLAEAGERANPGTPLLRLGSTARVKLTFAVPEASRPGLTLGQRLTATADALPGRTFPAGVSALGSQADPRTRAFPVELTAGNPGERLLPGMVARLSLAPAGPAPRRVTVPVAAVAGEGAETYVFLLGGGRAVRRPVTLGAPVGAERVVVRSGLSGGEALAAAPNRLTDGARVQLVDAQEARR
jgi:RND family efflux transporter MFP subunit